MAFDVHVTNVGKLADARIRINNFTVLAGPNSTGKSFVSRLLYSLFDGLNGNPVSSFVEAETRDLDYELRHLARHAGREDQTPRDLFSELEATRQLAASMTDLDGIVTGFTGLRNRVRRMHVMASGLRAPAARRSVEDVTASLEALSNRLDRMDIHGLLVAGVGRRITSNLLHNFQVPTVRELRGRRDSASRVSVDHFGDVGFTDHGVDFVPSPDGFFGLAGYSRLVYLESPICWKTMPALEVAADSPAFGPRRRGRLTGVPRYSHDLIRSFRGRYTGDPAFPDIVDRLTGDEVLGGRIVLTKTGNLAFHERGRSLSLSVAAAGTVNLGMIAFLIERKVLDKGACLFIDEPEAHLHPAWQVVMAETLFELSQRGVQVVISTYSGEIIKWLEVQVAKHPESRDHIALNTFPVDTPDGENKDDDFDGAMNIIAKSLSAPFADLYLEGL